MVSEIDVAWDLFLEGNILEAKKNWLNKIFY